MTDRAAATEAAVLARADEGVGQLTLNRPRALNALNLDMIGHLTAALDDWEDDTAVDLVVLDGAGERGLCAGGDVRALYEQIRSGHPEAAAQFFRAEYTLNLRIATYPKPIVALADGITMGGGIGLAGHASTRIVTERSRLAMPETRIGFTPDVGGSRLLAHAPGRLGEYLGLTGASMDAADALHAGFADAFVPAADLQRFRDDLREGAGSAQERIRLSLDRWRGEPRALSGLIAARPWIDDAFAAETVGGILARLRARPEPAASATADVLEELSPTGLAVTLAAVRRARGHADLGATLEQEFALVMWFATTQPDLVEGIRAQLVDKDRSPRWRPATIAELRADAAASALAYRPRTPLWGRA